MYKTILHATDLSEQHFELCKQANQFAEAIQARLHFLHVIEIPTSMQWAQSLGFAELETPSKEDAETVMASLGETFKIPPNNLHVEIGVAYQHILEKIKELNCDLVILGSNREYALPTFLGSTTHAVMHHAPCDVLTMRSAEQE